MADQVITESGQAPCRFGEIVPDFNWPLGEQLIDHLQSRVAGLGWFRGAAGHSRPLRKLQVSALVVWMLVFGSPWIASSTLAISPLA